MTALTIGAIDRSAGTIMLSGGGMPSPPPIFPAGSLLYTPRLDASGQPLLAVERKVIDKLTLTTFALNRDTDRSKVNSGPDYPLDIDDFKPPCKAHKLIGVYEGAEYVTGMTYRPAGDCKMRESADEGAGGEFCFVCKYLIVTRVDPALHALLDERHYPLAKKNG
jgi:hypothetical protein